MNQETKPENPPASEKTLRDDFAGVALQGLLSGIIPKNVDWADDSDLPGSFAKRSYEYADAMLAERSKRK